MAFADACAYRVLFAALVVTWLAACAPVTETARLDTDIEIPPDAVLTGQVSAAGSTDLAVDIGLARPVAVALAGIAVVDCGAGGATAYAAGLTELAPVGAAVTLVRSNAPTESDYDLTAFVHAADQDRIAEASVNEVLVRTGRARLNPPVDHSATAASARDQVAADTARVPAPDHDYRSVLAAAEDEAWQARLGPIGACATRQDTLDRNRDPAPTAQPAAPATETQVPPRIGITVQRPDVEITLQRSPRPRPCELVDRC
ncbi:hypothetical protein ACFV24_22400 [Nocardia fluminea]|uniref:hypothetical protein n=1 Tax=Nocardia fluminea TaxID=134984 RepID=UPI00366CF69B